MTSPDAVPRLLPFRSSSCPADTWMGHACCRCSSGQLCPLGWRGPGLGLRSLPAGAAAVPASPRARTRQGVPGLDMAREPGHSAPCATRTRRAAGTAVVPRVAQATFDEVLSFNLRAGFINASPYGDPAWGQLSFHGVSFPSSCSPSAPGPGSPEPPTPQTRRLASCAVLSLSEPRHRAES